MGSEQSRSHRQLAEAVSVVAWVLIGVSLSSVLFGSLPFELLQPEFQLRLTAAILSSSAFMLLGALLARAAKSLDKYNQKLEARADLIRKAARIFAVVLALLLPLQLVAGASVLSKLSSADSETLKQRRQVIYGLSRTEDEKSFRDYLLSLPDRPTLPATFDAPFPVIKKRALDNLKLGYKMAEAEVKEARSKRIEKFVAQFARNSVQALLMAYGFWWISGATFARSAPSRSSRSKSKS